MKVRLRPFLIFLSGIVVGVCLLRAGTLAYRSINSPPQATPIEKRSDWTGGVAERSALVALSKLDGAKVVLLGDSHFAIAPWQDLTGCTSMSNRGVPAGKASDLTDDAKRLFARPPSVVFVLVGINDLLAGHSPEQVVVDVMALVSVMADKSKIVLFSVFPVARGVGTADLNEKIRLVNTGLKRIRGAEFLDLTSKFMDENGFLIESLTTDGIHLRAAGYKIWRDAIAVQIAEFCH